MDKAIKDDPYYDVKSFFNMMISGCSRIRGGGRSVLTPMGGPSFIGALNLVTQTSLYDDHSHWQNTNCIANYVTTRSF